MGHSGDGCRSGGTAIRSTLIAIVARSLLPASLKVDARSRLAVGVVTLAVISIGYGLYLAVVGVEWRGLTESGAALPQREMVESRPAPQGLVAVVGGSGVLVGLALERLVVAWAGAAIISAFAVLFVFGVGGILVPLAALLLLLLAWLTWVDSRRRAQSGR
jgi:hypothetical protein